MTANQKTAARWAVFLALILISFALYWAGTSGSPEIQAALLILLVLIAALAALIG